jgi:leader peptidase (prepilin peptidase)/N-methyltransferase
MFIFYILFFIFGTIVGSFLNVVILRLKKNKSVIKNPSHCPFCKRKLRWFELIPVVSFFIQKGKCRCCHKKISWQYPIVEFFTGLIFVLIIAYFADFSFYGLINLCYLLVISCFLIVIFVYDLKYYLVSDKIVYPAIFVSLLYDTYLALIANQFSIFFSSILGAISVGGFFLFWVLVSKGKWMGTGDIKIGILLGLTFGIYQLFTTLFLTFFVGAIVAIILMILKKKKLKSEIPLGPFLTGAAFITLFWGNYLLDWYLNIFS